MADGAVFGLFGLAGSFLFSLSVLGADVLLKGNS